VNNRYTRHIQLPEIGEEGQNKLSNASVLMIGAGGLGCPILQYLAAAGVGKIGIVEFDIVDETNLQRQVLFTEADIKKPKGDIAKKQVNKLNSSIEVIWHNAQLTNQNALDIFKDYDVIVDGTDNYPSKYLINDACVLLGKPMVFGGVYRFDGQVSVFNYLNKNGERGPSYRCIFPNYDELSANCNDTGVLGVLPGVTGVLQANEVIKIITEAGEVMSGKILIFNLLKNSFDLISFAKNYDYSLFNEHVFRNMQYSIKCETANEITINELDEFLKRNVQVIDVRNSYEISETIDARTKIIPLPQILDRKEEITQNIPTLIYCQAGIRSIKAIEALSQFYDTRNFFSLKGGYVAWKANQEKRNAQSE